MLIFLPFNHTIAPQSLNKTAGGGRRAGTRGMINTLINNSKKKKKKQRGCQLSGGNCPWDVREKHGSTSSSFTKENPTEQLMGVIPMATVDPLNRSEQSARQEKEVRPEKRAR